MLAAGVCGSVVTMICYCGERYLDSYYSDPWVTAQNLDLATHTEGINAFPTTGTTPP